MSRVVKHIKRAVIYNAVTFTMPGALLVDHVNLSKSIWNNVLLRFCREHKLFDHVEKNNIFNIQKSSRPSRKLYSFFLNHWTLWIEFQRADISVRTIITTWDGRKVNIVFFSRKNTAIYRQLNNKITKKKKCSICVPLLIRLHVFLQRPPLNYVQLNGYQIDLPRLV